MRLTQWMKQSGLSQSEMARRTKIDQSLLCKYINRKRRPSADNIKAIRDATEGAVDLDDWPRLHPRKKKESAKSNASGKAA